VLSSGNWSFCSHVGKKLSLSRGFFGSHLFRVPFNALRFFRLHWCYLDRNGIKPRPGTPSLTHSHASPLSNLCPLWRKAPGRRETPLATATSPSAGTIQTRSQEPTHPSLDRHITVSTLCTDGSGPPVVLTIYLSLAWPRERRDCR
jgi:hypothetical protein